jgi:hypothetical protein
MIPRVSTVPVGYFRGKTFLEMDCPHCGRSHILLIPEQIDTPFVTVVPCTMKYVHVVSAVPVLYGEHYDQDGE